MPRGDTRARSTLLRTGDGGPGARLTVKLTPLTPKKARQGERSGQPVCWHIAGKVAGVVAGCDPKKKGTLLARLHVRLHPATQKKEHVHLALEDATRWQALRAQVERSACMHPGLRPHPVKTSTGRETHPLPCLAHSPQTRPHPLLFCGHLSSSHTRTRMRTARGLALAFFIASDISDNSLAFIGRRK